MQEYLILQLGGPMQSWGLPTFEGIRPSAPFPGRSGLLGLLGACLGIKRNDRAALRTLAETTRFAVRCDSHTDYRCVNLTDFHTVRDARERHGSLKMHNTIITRREYLYDASFTVAVWTSASSDLRYTLSQLSEAVKNRITRPIWGGVVAHWLIPLFTAVQSADNPAQALAAAAPGKGAIYSEEPLTGSEQRLSGRDEPVIDLPRQFARRSWFVIQGEEHVPE